MALWGLPLFLVAGIGQSSPSAWLAPVAVEDRASWESLELTGIGSFGLVREARPGVPEHLHTGIDITRPNPNYGEEPVFPASEGIVISKRDDGPYAQLIVEHRFEDGLTIWSVYEHIAGIRVAVGERVDPYTPMARFMNTDELNSFGWHFDHLHFEILKQRPRPLEPSPVTPSRFFGTYNTGCYTRADLDRYYYDPGEFPMILSSHPLFPVSRPVHPVIVLNGPSEPTFRSHPQKPPQEP